MSVSPTPSRPRSRARLLALAVTGSVLPLALPSVASAQWTGADYCAVQNTKGDWALIGGASCNPTPSSNPNASWTQALILDFDAHTATNAYDTSEVESFDSLYSMLADLSADHASDGWMYVANLKVGTGDYVYLMVNEAACAGNSDWAVAPVCDSLSSDAADGSHASAASAKSAAAQRAHANGGERRLAQRTSHRALRS